MQRFIYLLLVVTVFSSSLTACSKAENDNTSIEAEVAKTPEDAINGLIAAYAANDLDLIRQSLGSHHRFGSNIVDGLEWLGNCLKLMDQCIKTPVKVVETKTVGNEIAVAVFAKNLIGAPMSVWFITSLENGSYKVTGMNTRFECALKTPEQKAKDREEREPGDYSVC
jgi:hypothetical protein